MLSQFAENELPNAVGFLGNGNRFGIRGPASPVVQYVVGTAQPGNSVEPHNSQLHIGWDIDADGNAYGTEPVIRCTWDANHLDADSNRWMRFRVMYENADGSVEKVPIHVAVLRTNHEARLGFFDATPTSRPVVSGSWSNGSAGASLAAALASLGLIVNETVP